jgi:hypothetical protein
MILPTKNIKMQYSLLGCGAIILEKLIDRDTVSAVWEKVSVEDALLNYDKFVLTMDFLFMIGAIEYSNNLIVRCQYD